MIHLKNKHTYKGEGIYIGRQMPGIQGSPLGNPFREGRIRTPEEARLLGNRFPSGRVRTRDEAVEEFRIWLWMQIRMKGNVYGELLPLAKLTKQGDLTLIYCCALEEGHGAYLEYTVKINSP